METEKCVKNMLNAIRTLGLDDFVRDFDNEEGFMCCLGQWNSQCGIENNLLINQSNPSKLYSLGVKPNLLFLDKEGFHTKFSNEALIINDWSTTTVQEKALALKELCEDNGCELEFVNFPEGFFDVVSN